VDNLVFGFCHELHTGLKSIPIIPFRPPAAICVLSPIEYAEISVGGEAMGGMMELNESFGEGWQHIPSHWGTYIAVDDCDASYEAVKANGGNVFCPPFDAPNVGRICIASDPSGAFFSMIQFVKH